MGEGDSTELASVPVASVVPSQSLHQIKHLPRPSADEELDALFRRYRAEQQRQDRNELVVRHRWIAHYCANRFVGRGEPLDDLFQVAQLGVVKAVERFDPSRGVTFATFAIPTVLGELRRHFRDAAWAVHVNRPAKDHSIAVRRAVEVLGQRHARSPTVDELAHHLQIDPQDVLLGLDALRASRPETLDTDLTDVATAVGPGDDDETTWGIVVRQAIDELRQADRHIVHLRFYLGLTQQEIADRIGRNQAHVSRRLRRIYGELHERLRAEGAQHRPSELSGRRGGAA